MRSRTRWWRLVGSGLLVGSALAYASDPGFMHSAWDALIQQGYGVNVSFRLVPALAAALVVADAGGVFNRGRFGVSVSAMGGRWGVWRRFWIEVAVGTILLELAAFLGSFIGGGLISGQWSGLSANIELDSLGWEPTVAVPVLALWSTAVTTALVTSTASVGMALRSRLAAVALPAVVGLAISTVPELRLGPVLDWRDKAGVFGPPTTTWVDAVAGLALLCLVAVLAVWHIAIRQTWRRPWA